MRISYQCGNPIIRIGVRGSNGDKEYDAYLDTGAGRTLIPENDTTALGLPCVGETEVITGTGKDARRLFSAEIFFLNSKFHITVIGKNLPEQAGISAIVGRDILDKYKIYFNGVAGEFEIETIR